ncbi:MAG TPA: glycosyltransferase family 4 protein [Chloroflexi bacterium]|jgi:glycosyltransferase involved in cell wall biosynthesis|nr:glycosyltransferase family 4 protein [Chloroflexota bacterium]
MLIGIDASRAVAAERTGTENYCLHLIRALVELGSAHRFRLYLNEPPTDDALPCGDGVEWRLIPFPRLWTHLRLGWEVTLRPPDVLYVPSHVIPLIHPRRSVATVHDLGYLYYPEAHTRWSRWYLGWSTRHNARASRRVIVDSLATRDDLVRWYGVDPAKTVVAYPAGVRDLAPVADPDKIASVRRRYDTGERYVLYVGTLQPRKNLETLVRAFAQLARRSLLPRDTRLVLAGRRGWLTEELDAAIAASGCAERIVLPGYVAGEDLATLLSGALAFVMPSWYEGFGLPVLEAMACGTPVVCSRAASLPEVAGDAALLFDPADEGGLAAALARLAAEPALRAELALRGLRRARAFTWERCAEIVLATLEEVASEGARGT